MSTLQSSSGLATSFKQRIFIRNLLERKVDGTLMRSQASCASRGEDSVVGNYLTSSAPPSASSSSSQWSSIHTEELCFAAVGAAASGGDTVHPGGACKMQMHRQR
jgi:hypothetical protein